MAGLTFGWAAPGPADPPQGGVSCGEPLPNDPLPPGKLPKELGVFGIGSPGEAVAPELPGDGPSDPPGPPIEPGNGPGAEGSKAGWSAPWRAGIVGYAGAGLGEDGVAEAPPVIHPAHPGARPGPGVAETGPALGIALATIAL